MVFYIVYVSPMFLTVRFSNFIGEALTGLSGDFFEHKRLTQQVQSKLSSQAAWFSKPDGILTAWPSLGYDKPMEALWKPCGNMEILWKTLWKPWNSWRFHFKNGIWWGYAGDMICECQSCAWKQCRSNHWCLSWKTIYKWAAIFCCHMWLPWGTMIRNWAVHSAKYGILAGKVGFLQLNRKLCDEQINTKWMEIELRPMNQLGKSWTDFCFLRSATTWK